MVIFISGTPAAGKSTVSKALAEKYLKSAYIEVDNLWDMVVGGNVAPWDPKGPEQFEFAEKNFLDIIKNFVDKGYVVVLDYIFNDEQVGRYKEILGDVHGFLLLPSIETLKKRDLERDPDHAMAHRIEALYPGFANAPHPILKVIDSTGHTVDETVNEIVALLA